MTAKPKTPTKTQKVFAAVNPESVIHQTTNYEKFKRMPGNRTVKPHHVHAIKEKILEKDLKSPVVINRHWEVIDGQHTVEARKELELPIYYRFGSKMNLHDVQTLNSTSLPWSNEDFCDSYIELGNKHYKVYRAFRKKYELQHDVAMVLLTGRTHKASRKIFREGEFHVADLTDAEKKAAQIYALKDLGSAARSDVFVKALMIANQRDGFVFSRFLEKAKENRITFQYWRTIDQNLTMIETIYNTGLGRKVPLRYDLKKPRFGRSVYDKAEPEADEKEEVTDDTEGNGKAGKPRGAMVKVGGRVLGVSARAK